MKNQTKLKPGESRATKGNLLTSTMQDLFELADRQANAEASIVSIEEVTMLGLVQRKRDTLRRRLSSSTASSMSRAREEMSWAWLCFSTGNPPATM